MSAHLEPPKATERLLRAALGASPYRDDILGDMHESYARLRTERSVLYARWWYRREAARLAARFATRLRLQRQPRGSLMDRLTMQVRLAIRSLSKRPWMSAAVVGTLALGIGANTAIFGAIDALILRPYPFHDVERVVMPVETAPDLPYRRGTVSPANFLDWRRDLNGTIDHLSVFQWWDVNLVGRDEPEHILGFHVSADFFAALDVSPALGRGFRAEEETRGHDAVIVLSDGLWKRRFGGDRSILGQSVLIDGSMSEVIGVAPPGFGFPMGAEIWAPLSFDPATAPSRNVQGLTVLGRLTNGVTFDDAQARVAVEGQRLAHDYRVDNAKRGIRLYSLKAGMADLGTPSILALWQAAAIFVLLIACANIMNLLLARGTERSRELALRLALGCSRRRLIFESLVESGVLVCVAAPLSVGAAWVFLSLLRGALPPRIVRFVPGWTAMTVNTPLLAVTLAVAALTTVLFGVLPTLQSLRSDVSEALKSEGRSSAAPGRQRLRRALVVAEVALVLPLLVAAMLGIKSVEQTLIAWQGYDPNGILALKVSLPRSRYPDADAHRRFANRSLEELATVPGAIAVTAASALPASDEGGTTAIEIASAPPADPALPPRASYRVVSAKYFDVMRIPIVIGRPFSASDTSEAAPVVIVSAAFAKKYWPDGRVMGQRLRITNAPWMTVVGVCGDLVHDWFDERYSPTIYRPLDQAPRTDMMFALRTSTAPSAIGPDVRRSLARVDATQPIFDMMPMRQMVSESTIGLQFVAAVMSTFAGLALMLAVLGLYAVMTYLVAQRVREIGVRIALGATTGDVFRLAIGQASRLTAAGVGVGLVLSLLLSRAMEAGLVGIIQTDLKTTVALAVALGCVSIAASFLPARRAAEVDPIVALRSE